MERFRSAPALCWLARVLPRYQQVTKTFLPLRPTAHCGLGAQIGTGYAQAAKGNGHFLGLKQDGSLWGWGRNEVGQLGVPPGPVSLPLTQVVFPAAPSPQPVNGQITAQGPSFNLLLTATLTPDPAHTQGTLFFIAILPDGRVFTNTRTGWAPLDAVKREGYGTGLQATTAPGTMPRWLAISTSTGSPSPDSVWGIKP